MAENETGATGGGPHIDDILERGSDQVDHLLDLVNLVDDEIERLRLQTGMIEMLREAGFALSEQRRQTAVSLNSSGISYAKLADILGVSRGRIQQLITGVGAPKRSGVIETEMRVAAAQMRMSGASDIQVVESLVPKIRGYKSGSRITVPQIAQMLSVDENITRPVVAKVDGELRRKKQETATPK